MTAARAGSADVVNALIEKGANVNETEAWHGQAALMWAAAENHAAAIKVLAAHGAEMTARSKELSFPNYRYETNGMAVLQLPKGGWTALMYAARQNAKDAVAAFANVHADLNATTKQEGTALQIAIINIHYDLANLLLDRRLQRHRLDRDDRAVRGRRHAGTGEPADAPGAEAARFARRARDDAYAVNLTSLTKVAPRCSQQRCWSRRSRITPSCLHGPGRRGGVPLMIAAGVCPI
jgi:ankyrin repeat protein